MSKVRDLLSKVGGLFEIFANEVPSLDSEKIRDSFTKKFEDLGFDGVQVGEVQVYDDGNIIVEFEDFEGDEMAVLFGIDQDEGAYAVVLGDDLDDIDDIEPEGEIVEIDLSPLFPTEVETPFGKYLNLHDLGWFNKSSILAMLNIGDIDANIEGNSVEYQPDDRVEELYKVVVRGGKKVKLPLVRKKRKKVLTAKQKAGIRKGVLTRKKTASQAARKRKLSLKVRKNLKLGNQPTPKGYRKQESLTR